MELQHLTRLGKRIGLSVIFFFTIPASIVKAQVVPDGTLKSTVETIQELMKIDGGLQQGSNLFHSFEEFSIPEGMEASFENAIEIENIFTRVTGDSASTINGTLSAQGGANLFLMNPNGIVFGQDASINIGGSFIATTADSIQFQDGTEFAATGTEDPTPLLTNEIPIGLGFGSDGNSGEITVNGAGNETDPGRSASGAGVPTGNDDNFQGLEVDSDSTLALIGGDVTLDGGTLRSQGGQIEIGSVDGSGTIQLETINNKVFFDYQEISSLGDIQLSNSAVVDVSGEGGGDIQVTGDNLTLLSGGRIIGDTLGSLPGGILDINISDTVYMEALPGSANTVDNTQISTENVLGATGDGGSIEIDTQNLILKSESQITASVNGSGDAGSIDITATDSIEIDGKSVASDPVFGSAISSAVVDEEATGNGGDVNISTNELTITNGGIISVDTFGKGSAGNLSIRAIDSIELTGVLPEGFLPSGLSALTLTSGNGGNISVETGELSVLDGAAIAVSSGEGATGSAGAINILAEDINVEDSGIITASSATDTGGNIEINASDIELNDEGVIEAIAGNEGQGGNITINTSNLTTKKNSLIEANADGGNGGNIAIDAETLLGLDNSDITANAVEGDGGNINITATSILGFEERPELTPLSDITASSEFGVDGNININSPETNAEEDVQVSAKKPEAPLTPLEFVKGCQLPEGILTTRGRGVPESPYPFPFGYFSYDESDGDVYQKAKETMRQERLRQQRSERENGISKHEARERRQATELAMLREKQRLLPNRHAHLKYEVTDDREVGSMLLPAPKGRLVKPEDDRLYEQGIVVFLSQSNEVPPISQEKRLREEGNVLQINPDGSKHFLRMFLMSHPTEEMCQSTVGRK